MPFKTLTSFGRYVVVELEAGELLVRGSHGRVETAEIWSYRFSIYHCCNTSSNGSERFVPGHRPKRDAGPPYPWSQLYSARWEVPESDY